MTLTYLLWPGHFYYILSPSLKSEDTLGLPESAELQIQSTPGDSQGEMEEKVGCITVYGNN